MPDLRCMCGDSECPSCGAAQGTLTRKRVLVTVYKVLEDWWGANECLEAGGHTAVCDMLLEEPLAFLDGAVWAVQQVSEEAPDAPQ